MKITKGDLVDGAYKLIRISGITINASNEDVVVALQVADDYAAELKGTGLDLSYQQPTTYGISDPSDNSGLTQEMAGPFKKLLALELVNFFGKPATPVLLSISFAGMRALENIVVSVPDAQNPPTLPFGSGNELDYRDRKFYNEPAINNDALYVFKGDILNYSHDFSDWLVDETLVSVVWESADNGVLIANESFNDTIATAELTFDKLGGYSVCITATKTNSTDKVTVRQNFIIRECQQTGLVFTN